MAAKLHCIGTDVFLFFQNFPKEVPHMFLPYLFPIWVSFKARLGVNSDKRYGLEPMIWEPQNGDDPQTNAKN